MGIDVSSYRISPFRVGGSERCVKNGCPVISVWQLAFNYQGLKVSRQ